jgi:ABC-type lipoprotein release transport system permease subunit
VFLGIAFLTSVLLSETLVAALHGQVDPSAQARQDWLVKMSLLVCAVGITNSMFMSVTERFREIGTMKCLGALDSFIVRLFLIESGLLGLAGSILGVIVGFGVMMLLAMAKDGVKIWGQLDYLIVLRNVAFAVGVGVVLSILAAVPPAMKAAKMPPASALRTEV